MSDDGMCIRIPGGEVLHTAATYEAADRWRHVNNQRTFICPEWPEDAL